MKFNPDFIASIRCNDDWLNCTDGYRLVFSTKHGFYTNDDRSNYNRSKTAREHGSEKALWIAISEKFPQALNTPPLGFFDAARQQRAQMLLTSEKELEENLKSFYQRCTFMYRTILPIMDLLDIQKTECNPYFSTGCTFARTLIKRKVKNRLTGSSGLLKVIFMASPFKENTFELAIKCVMDGFASYEDCVVLNRKANDAIQALKHHGFSIEPVMLGIPF